MNTPCTTCRKLRSREVKYDSIVILDHTPALVGGGSAKTAYAFAFMRALWNRANAEAKA